jgi:NAD(P)-dependent dehydrogenase (short-subunit alcohol dehydrogenase family)
MFELTGKRAVITGISRGIGQAAAVALAKVFTKTTLRERKLPGRPSRHAGDEL